MRTKMLLVPAVVLGLLAFLPPVAAGEPEVAAPIPGFTAVVAYAHGQMATGYFFAVGDEENRLVGALSVINGPPAGSGNVAAFVQRGVAASYVYGLLGGGGPGQSGILPQPPPGEAGAYFPADPPEATWEGPVTAGAGGPVVDGRFHAKATGTPTGVADAAVTAVEVPDQFKVEQAVVVSHTEPVEGGVAAESVSVVRGLSIGPLRVESLVSRAYGFVSSRPDAPKGTATTVLEGVTVDGTAVQVTDQGVVVADQAAPGAQQQVNDALTEAGFSDVRLTASSATPGDQDESVRAVAGALRVVHRDAEFGAQNPQGFSGGGFSVGGAEVRVLGRRCVPACPGPAGSGVGAELAPVDAPIPDTGAAPPSPGAAPVSPPSVAEATTPPADDLLSGTTSAAYDAGGSTLAGITSGSFEPHESSSYTTATTPASVPADAPPSAAPLSSEARRQALAAAFGTGPKEATWARDAYLAFTAALVGVLVVGGRYFVGARVRLPR